MSANESKHEQVLKKMQLILGVGVGASWIKEKGAPPKTEASGQ